MLNSYLSFSSLYEIEQRQARSPTGSLSGVLRRDSSVSIGCDYLILPYRVTVTDVLPFTHDDHSALALRLHQRRLHVQAMIAGSTLLPHPLHPRQDLA